MKIVYLLSISLSLLLSGCREDALVNSEERPNIILFVADDLGYGDLGIYGQSKIETPNIDSLAKQGIIFTNHYAGSAVCAPSRCVLLTGMHSGHASVRYNNPWRERTTIFNAEVEYCDKYLEGQYPMNASDVTIAEVLKKYGYTTGIVGKWGLGAPISVSTPNRQGFDYFYGYNCQRQAHNLYPQYLWENGKKIELNNSFYYPDWKFPKDVDVYDPKQYQNYKQKDYAPELMHQKALEFIKTNSDNPFFLYYATPLPHPPLQIPPQYIEEYHQLFGDEQPYLGENTNDIPSRYPRASYAAMVSMIDAQIGEMVELLKSKHLLEKTIIIITSDNGPAFNGVSPFFNSAGPFSEEHGRIKSSLYEGGIRVPLIVYWKDKTPANSISSHVCASYDIFATLLECANTKEKINQDGISFKPLLEGKPVNNHPFLYWEFPNGNNTEQRAVLKDGWKLIVNDIKNYGFSKTELYYLKKDSLELTNLSAKYPDKVKELLEIVKKQHKPIK